MNAYDIPELDPALCAAGLAVPVTKWGTRRRSDPMPGTWHFYAHDYVFAALRRRPLIVPATGCRVAVEPNFSTHNDMPMAEILWLTHEKRRLARHWQLLGVHILVDLNVCRKAYVPNFLGVPFGWTAYATRAHRGASFDAICAEHAMACAHAGTDEVLFAVFGGGKQVKRACREAGFAWVPEHRQVVAGREREYSDA